MVQRYDLVGDMDGNCNLNEARMEKSDDGIYVYYRVYKELDDSYKELERKLHNLADQVLYAPCSKVTEEMAREILGI